MDGSEIISTFGNQVRTRVCGIAIDQGEILLVNHVGLNDRGIWWAPPGGGVQFRESLEEALIREFKEETGLLIEAREQLFITEYIQGELHAIEVFFQVNILSGDLIKGIDPELNNNKQSITEVKYMTFEELKVIKEVAKHHCLHGVSRESDVLSKNGYFPYCSKMNK